MQTIFNLLRGPAYIDLPYHLEGWLGGLLLLALLMRGCFHFWERRPVRRKWHWAVLAALILMTPVTSLFFGVLLPRQFVLPMPGLPVNPVPPALMVFSALPWVLAGGIFGPVVAAALGAAAGLLLGLFETHTFFTAIELAGLALLYAAAVRQPYRTPFYRFLRQPLGAAAFLAVAFSPVYIFTAFFAAGGSLAVRIDYALMHSWGTMLTNGAELLVAGLAAQVVFALAPQLWPRVTAPQPSPSESSLQLRFFYTAAPLVVVVLFILLISDWFVAGSAAKKMINSRMTSIAGAAAETLPYFEETGTNLIKVLADEGLLNLQAGEASQALSDRLRSVPYFRQLTLFDASGQMLAGYPESDPDQLQLAQEELSGISFALTGVPNQNYTIDPLPGEKTAQVSFIAPIFNRAGQVRGVLLGRTDLNSNPFTQPAVQALTALHDLRGEGLILDQDRNIVYHTQPGLLMGEYTGELPAGEIAFYEGVSATGVRQMVMLQRIPAQSWSVLLLVPSEQAQALALEIAVPLLALLLGLSVVLLLVLRLALRSVTASLSSLAQESTLIARGQLDHALQVKRVDEVGRFASAFEQMRVSLKDRLEELNRLLMVSQGVASHLEAADAVAPILQASLRHEATSARLILVREVTLDQNGDKPVAFGAGVFADRYAHLDQQIFDAMRSQDLLSIPNTSRMRRLNIAHGAAQPGAVIALALHDENQYYGALWVAYDMPHTFTEEEVRFLSTLAGQAALAATNARLYATAEIGRQRLEAVLSSTPDPVLVIDDQMKLLLLNPAAMQIHGLISTSTPGRSVREVVCLPELLDLILAPLEGGSRSRELTLPSGKIYHASVSMVAADRPVGRICILRDITHYKQLDTLKSEFVSTVSHDLRSPLTLMKGYSSMLGMVGELNDQQKSYVKKIQLGIENMTRLVGNLLDLGRIEAGVGLQIEKVVIGDMIERVIGTLQPNAAMKHIQLVQDHAVEEITQQPVTIQADPALLERAIYNLIENAIKYTNVGGNVNIGVQLRSKTVLFAVRDTGIGIAPLDLPHMFEKFYRSGRREAHKERGTGLGLAIVKTIAERHGGRVWVESYLGKGSIFYLEVPFEQHQGEIA